jgi:four helix bundle protein
MASSFTKLDAYTRACDVADELYTQVATWPSFDKWTTGKQIVRSADSIGANIAESTGRWHPNDKRQFLYFARGSACETEHWIRTAERRGLLRPGTHERLDDVARPLNGLINKTAPK